MVDMQKNKSVNPHDAVIRLSALSRERVWQQGRGSASNRGSKDCLGRAQLTSLETDHPQGTPRPLLVGCPLALTSRPFDSKQSTLVSLVCWHTDRMHALTEQKAQRGTRVTKAHKTPHWASPIPSVEESPLCMKRLPRTSAAPHCAS